MLKTRGDFNFSEQLGVDKFVNGVDVNGVVLLVMTESPPPQKTTFPVIFSVVIFSIFLGTTDLTLSKNKTLKPCEMFREHIPCHAPRNCFNYRKV